MNNLVKPPPFYPICSYQEDIAQINEVIKQKLYISGFQGAENEELINQLKISHILNITGDEKKFSHITYLCIDNVLIMFIDLRPGG